MQVRNQLYINGLWAASKGDKSIDVINASTEELMGRYGRGEFLEYKSLQLKAEPKA